MIVNLHLKNEETSKVEMAIDFFKDALYDASDSILHKLTKSIEIQNKKLNHNFEFYKNNSHLLLGDAMMKEYERIDNAIDIYEALKFQLEEYKDISPSFKRLYEAINNYYETLVIVPSELGFIEAKLINEQRKLKNAS